MAEQNLKKHLLFIVAFIVVPILAFGLAVSQSWGAAWQDKTDPWVIQQAEKGQTEFIIFLADQADLSGAAQLKTKAEKGEVDFGPPAFSCRTNPKTCDRCSQQAWSRV